MPRPTCENTYNAKYPFAYGAFTLFGAPFQTLPLGYIGLCHYGFVTSDPFYAGRRTSPPTNIKIVSTRNTIKHWASTHIYRIFLSFLVSGEGSLSPSPRSMVQAVSALDE